jgi:hypothetical protein
MGNLKFKEVHGVVGGRGMEDGSCYSKGILGFGWEYIQVLSIASYPVI